MKRNYNLLHKLAWSFSTTTGLDEKDLFQEAFLAYYEALKIWNPAKSKLSTFTWMCVKGHLINYVKGEKRQSEIFDTLDKVKNKETSSSNLFEKLSKDSEKVLKVLLKNPSKYLLTPNNAINTLIQELKEEGWETGRIESVIKELKRIV